MFDNLIATFIYLFLFGYFIGTYVYLLLFGNFIVTYGCLIDSTSCLREVIVALLFPNMIIYVYASPTLLNDS